MALKFVQYSLIVLTVLFLLMMVVYLFFGRPQQCSGETVIRCAKAHMVDRINK